MEGCRGTTGRPARPKRLKENGFEWRVMFDFNAK